MAEGDQEKAARTGLDDNSSATLSGSLSNHKRIVQIA